MNPQATRCCSHLRGGCTFYTINLGMRQSMPYRPVSSSVTWVCLPSSPYTLPSDRFLLSRFRSELLCSVCALRSTLYAFRPFMSTWLWLKALLIDLSMSYTSAGNLQRSECQYDNAPHCTLSSHHSVSMHRRTTSSRMTRPRAQSSATLTGVFHWRPANLENFL
jgi:hypothetical protein